MKRILVADDKESSREFVRTVLEHAGCQLWRKLQTAARRSPKLWPTHQIWSCSTCICPVWTDLQ